MATKIPSYTGNVPNRELDGEEAWSQNYFNLLAWIASVFTSFFNTAVDEVETNRSAVENTAAAVAQDKADITVMRDIVLDATSVYLSDYVVKAVQTTDYTASNMDFVPFDTSGSPLRLVFPADPSPNEKVGFHDVSGTFDINHLTLDPNGKTVMGEATGITVSHKNATFLFQFINNDWRLVG